MSKIKLSASALKEAANYLRMLSHPVRLQIVQLLLKNKHSVGEIAKRCHIPHNLASTHLKALERYDFLESERVGRSVYYVVIESHLIDLLRCIEKRFG